MGRRIERARQEEGFTLIELLVVVIIIGILAAIAIPIFLNQRQRAWIGSVESDVRNAAIEVETQGTRSGDYPANNLLVVAGIIPSAGVTLFYDAVVDPTASPTVATADGIGGLGFEICGEHENVEGHIVYRSASGGLSEEFLETGRCDVATFAGTAAAGDEVAGETPVR